MIYNGNLFLMIYKLFNVDLKNAQHKCYESILTWGNMDCSLRDGISDISEKLFWRSKVWDHYTGGLGQPGVHTVQHVFLQKVSASLVKFLLSQRAVITMKDFHFSSVLSLWIFMTPWTIALQASLSITNYQSMIKLIHLVSDAIQPPHSLSYPSPPAFDLSQHQGLFQWVHSSAVAKVLELQLEHQSFQKIVRMDFLLGCLVWSPCCPGDSQECSPTLQFKSSVLSFLYGPNLTSIHDYWKNHRVDSTNLCWQSNVSAF